MPEKARLYAPEAIGENRPSITGEAYHYLVRVLRVQPGETCTLFGIGNTEVLCKIDEIRDSHAVLTPIETRKSCAESPVDLTLAIAVGKGKKLEGVVEQVTALGVRRIVPFVGERSVARRENPRLGERLATISVEACRQSRRAQPPEIISVAKDLGEAFANAKPTAASLLFLDESGGRKVTGVCSTIDPKSHVLVFCGPEGGWSDTERELLLDQGGTPVSLGPRILRTELAAAVGVALVENLLAARIDPAEAGE